MTTESNEGAYHPAPSSPVSESPPPYEPFDQAKWLGEPPWSNPALERWEAAHGHDARLKCYVEFGCQVIEPTLEREIESLRARLSTAEEALHAATQARVLLAGTVDTLNQSLTAEREARQRAEEARDRYEKALRELVESCSTKREDTTQAPRPEVLWRSLAALASHPTDEGTDG
jgi:hypothetical protein